MYNNILALSDFERRGDLLSWRCQPACIIYQLVCDEFCGYCVVFVFRVRVNAGPITKFITLHFKLPFQRRGFLKTRPFVVNSTFKQLSQLTAIFCNNFYILHFPSFSFLNSQQKSHYTIASDIFMLLFFVCSRLIQFWANKHTCDDAILFDN